MSGANSFAKSSEEDERASSCSAPLAVGKGVAQGIAVILRAQPCFKIHTRVGLCGAKRLDKRI